MSVTIMKMYYAKQKPSIVHYRKFKNFCNDSFIKDIKTFSHSCVINKMLRLKY